MKLWLKLKSMGSEPWNQNIERTGGRRGGKWTRSNLGIRKPSEDCAVMGSMRIFFKILRWPGDGIVLRMSDVS